MDSLLYQLRRERKSLANFERANGVHSTIGPGIAAGAPTDIELDIWSRWPKAGVCVCMGAASGDAVAIDIDTDEWEIIEAIESVVGRPLL